MSAGGWLVGTSAPDWRALIARSGFGVAANSLAQQPRVRGGVVNAQTILVGEDILFNSCGLVFSRGAWWSDIVLVGGKQSRLSCS